MPAQAGIPFSFSLFKNKWDPSLRWDDPRGEMIPLI
jgi:hypothetical protein